MSDDRPILRVWPRVAAGLPLARLAELPTAVEPLHAVAEAAGAPHADAWIKRDDRTSPHYGGNKVRTLEVLFGRAVADGTERIVSTGAYGSNHSVATLLHAPRVGLTPAVVAFPQPWSTAAADNLRLLLGAGPGLTAVPHWSFVPLGMALAGRAAPRTVVMPPGGATPLGALGYVSAALELAEQVAAGACPAPAVVVVGVGSTCTSAGLLLGFHHAARRGLGLARAPRLVAARVSPWPITAAFRIVSLAHRASALLAALAGDPSLEVPAAALAAGLEVDGRCLGRGYGYPTESGRDAIRVFEASGHRLDATYGAKSAAAFLRRLRDGERRPMLYWATKSSAPLPGPDPEVVAAAPARLRRWLDRGGRRGTV